MNGTSVEPGVKEKFGRSILCSGLLKSSWSFVTALARAQASFPLTFEYSVVSSGMCQEVTVELNM